MASRDTAIVNITPQVLLKAYACGIFPMAESAEDPSLFWVEPERRGIIPLDGFRVSRRLARTVRSDRYSVWVDRDFEAVLDGCSAPAPGRARTWINGRIRALYGSLYDAGHCHTVEVYDRGSDQESEMRDSEVHDRGSLVGGLYGVSLGAAFFGESMFHLARDASKIALVHLVARLRAGGFTLLDTQFVTDHLQSFGAAEVSRSRYHKLLTGAVANDANFTALPIDRPIAGADALRLLASADQRGSD